ncbi:MAG: transglycosylase domain-containing protein, partial [Oscillospiraceae bacterium]|nr:transglycosylase domain-containing protein [Oscillospiraceae bacterium]
LAGGAPLLLNEYDPSLSTEFYAKASADGPYVLVETVSAGENRIWAGYDEMGQYLKDAIVAIEDKRFWDHQGVDWKRTLSAFANMFLSMRNNFGGSTITQQLIKNITEKDETTVQRKFEEIFSALALERIHTKEYILENYLNVIPLGNQCNGVKTAAELYFAKDLDELTLLESACLAGITNNPYLYDPFQNPRNNRRRTEYILWEMYDQDLVTEAEYTRAMSQKLNFTSREKVQESRVRSWYVDETILELQRDLMERNGWSSLQMAVREVYSGGLSVYMAQDLSIQRYLDEVWKDDGNWPAASDAERPEGSMLIMDPYTGDIAAMIGSRAEKTANLLSNMATSTVRQPGSAIKPLSVYAPAFEMGYLTPNGAMLDAPVELEGGGSYPLNLPRGYDGRVTVQYAIEVSKNTVAVRIMRDMLTPQVSRQFMMQRFHVTSLVDTVTAAGLIDAESSMALGGLTHGMSVKELAAAYSVFPSGGTYSKPRLYTEVRDKNGELLIDNRPQRSVSITPLTAHYMNAALQGVVTSGTARAARLGSMPTAGKTGTTNDNYDRWFCGYTPYYVGVCWYGYKMPRNLGDIQPNPAMILWVRVMERVHEGLEVRGFEVPPGLVTAQYCRDSGMLPTDACRLDPREESRILTGTYGPRDAPRIPCTMHREVYVCGITGRLAMPDCPTATRRSAALLYDPDRIMYAPRIDIGDEGYTYRLYGADPYIIEDPETQFAPEQRDSHFNHFCGYPHPSSPPQPPPEPPPGGPDDGGDTPPATPDLS